MTDAHNTSDNMIDDIDDTEIDDIAIEQNTSSTSIDTRRRLEEKIAERQLAREIREFDFDF